MAMYRLEAKIVGRNISKAKGRGKTQSVVAASAYRSANPADAPAKPKAKRA